MSIRQHIRTFNKSKINVDLAQTKSGAITFLVEIITSLHVSDFAYIKKKKNQCGSTFQKSKFKLNLLVEKKRT